MASLKRILKYLLGLFFVTAGLNHFISPDFYLKIMPPYLLGHLLLVYLSGFFAMALGVLVLIPKFTRLSAWGLIALLIAVFPANIHMSINAELYPEYNPAVLWLRLPLQVGLIAWAYWYTEADVEKKPVRDVAAP
jgi:uncharacterized membrane protein